MTTPDVHLRFGHPAEDLPPGLPHVTKKQRIAGLESSLALCLREASRQRLVILLLEPESTKVILDQRADDYTILANTEWSEAPGPPLRMGGEITIRWR